MNEQKSPIIPEETIRKTAEQVGIQKGKIELVNEIMKIIEKGSANQQMVSLTLDEIIALLKKYPPDERKN